MTTKIVSKPVSKPLALAIALVLFSGAPLAEQVLSRHGVDLGGSALAQQGKGSGGQGSGHAGGQGSGQAGGQGGPQYKGGQTTAAPTAEDPDSDKRGPKYMGGSGTSPDERGGKPAWAQEGIPEVELGRLNVARAPDQVLERQFLEALNTWQDSMESFYEMTAEAAAALLVANYDGVVRFDSPLMNLALYKDLLVDNTTQLPGVTPASTLDLAAILLGSASDKTVSISTDTVVAINTILDLTMSEADVAILAAKAEIVRAAVYTGHD